ncbi:hypothetical protein AGMMS49928_06310 [Spirochaetia bacterium]|nr:hypothetical protein AGMMS49928_06310 [Spirochaetia bacterium]
MVRINRRLLLSPTGIFIIYSLASALIIMGFRFFFPPSPPPLPYFYVPWRLNQGLLTFLDLFPALALSSLVVPFGFRNIKLEEFSAFSSRFLEAIKNSIIAAIVVVAVYGLLFFLISPLARNREDIMRAQGSLYTLAKQRAQESAEEKDWAQAYQFVDICERIWPLSAEMEKLRVSVSVGMDKLRGSRSDHGPPENEKTPGSSAALAGIPGQRAPVDADEALAMAQKSLDEQRYYDAHWLAGLAGRLARPNSIEAQAAVKLTSEIWNLLTSITPNQREEEAWSLYRLKREGYEWMVSGDWIRAYYLFRAHQALGPGDPDVVNFLALCQKGISEIAFFIDEIELAVGEILTGAVFSLPAETEPGKNGRVALRISSLSTSGDYSYGVGIELMAFDRDENFLYRLTAPYGKIVPMTVNGSSRLVLLMRALDRYDETKRWEPERTNLDDETVPGTGELVMNMVYEDFLVLSNIRRGPENLETADLLEAEKRLGDFGFVPQVFQAEIIYRFCEPVFFLPITILIILLGWRFRAKTKPRYSGGPMLLILPVVFYGMVHIYRSCLNNLAIWSVVSFGYIPSLILFVSGTIIFFVLSLILLSSQHG